MRTVSGQSNSLLTIFSVAGKEADVKEAHKAIVEKLGHPEVLVYNAGLSLSRYASRILLS